MSNVIKYNYIKVDDTDRVTISSPFEELSLVDITADYSTPLEVELPPDPVEQQEQMIEMLLKDENEVLGKRADEIIANANAEAERIIAQANATAEQIIENNKEQGYQDGYQDGVNVANHELESMRNDLNNQLMMVQENARKDAELIEKKVVDTVCSVIQNITGIITQDYKYAICHIIENALGNSDKSNSYLVRVSKEDYPAVFEKRYELENIVKEEAMFNVILDEELKKNQCLIETDSNIIDVSLDEQMNNLIANLRLLASS